MNENRIDDYKKGLDMVLYNKLVRDRIPDIIISNGEIPITRVLDDAEYSALLENKLDEEVAEFHECRNIEELADILEVVYALSEVQGYSVDELLNVYQKKHNDRGGFSEKIFLIGKE